MSQWSGVARSNYVKIKDMAALKAAIENIDITTEEDDEGRIAFFGADSDSGGWPSVEVDDEYAPFNPAVVICPHMEEGEVLVFMEVGFERQKYVTGVASAYDHTGRVVQVNLNDIYTKAAKVFRVPKSFVTVAEY